MNRNSHFHSAKLAATRPLPNLNLCGLGTEDQAATADWSVLVRFCIGGVRRARERRKSMKRSRLVSPLRRRKVIQLGQHWRNIWHLPACYPRS